MKQPYIISPLYDFVFALLFGDQRHIANTKAFLKSILDIPEDDYKSLIVVNPFLKRVFKTGKGGIVDVRLTSESGRVIHIELQVNKIPAMRERVLYYASKLLAEQLKQGDEYEELHQVISIIICDHTVLREEASYMTEYELRNRNGRSFTNLLKVIILELPKVPESDNSAAAAWLKFFKCTRGEEYDMLAKKHPDIREAVLTLKKLSWWEERRMIKEQISLWEADNRIWKKAALAEGRAEGRAAGKIEGRAEGKVEGRTEGILEVARRMKARGRTPEEIVEDTGLSAEQIKRL